MLFLMYFQCVSVIDGVTALYSRQRGMRVISRYLISNHLSPGLI